MNELIIKKGNQIILNPNISKNIAEFEKQIKALKETEDKLKAEILAEMEAQGIIKLETEDLTISYVSETYRETFDSKALKADDEEMYNKYIKLSPVKSSIRIKVK
jgi:regulator of replication initiation timing